MRSFTNKEYNLVYIDASDLIVNVYLMIFKHVCDINTLKDKDLKKLIFHYVITLILRKNKNSSKRPVYFFNKTLLMEFVDKRYIKCFVSIIKHLKTLLPVPLIFVNNDDIFINNNGELKDLNERITNFYQNFKKSTAKLRKYLQSEEFYELVKVLNNIKNIKQLST